MPPSRAIQNTSIQPLSHSSTTTTATASDDTATADKRWSERTNGCQSMNSPRWATNRVRASGLPGPSRITTYSSSSRATNSADRQLDHAIGKLDEVRRKGHGSTRFQDIVICRRRQKVEMLDTSVANSDEITPKKRQLLLQIGMARYIARFWYSTPITQVIRRLHHAQTTIRLHPGRNRHRPGHHRPAARRRSEGSGTDQQREGQELRQRLPQHPDVYLRLPGQVSGACRATIRPPTPMWRQPRPALGPAMAHIDGDWNSDSP